MFRRRKEEARQRLFNWRESATGDFCEDELKILRDRHPEKIAQAMWNSGRLIQRGVLVELIAHGNPRKAALVARILARQHPIYRELLEEDVGEETADSLLNINILNLPSKPDEYPRR